MTGGSTILIKDRMIVPSIRAVAGGAEQIARFEKTAVGTVRSDLSLLRLQVCFG
jgi:hypothetical protein